MRRCSIVLVILSCAAAPVGAAEEEPTPPPTEASGDPSESTPLPGEPSPSPDEPAPLPTEPAPLPTEPAPLTTEPAPLPTEPAADADAVDETGLRADFDAAFSLMLEERWAEAIPLLSQVLETTEDSELRGSAASMLRYARLRSDPGPAGAEPALDRRGRFPLVAWATVGGLAAGVELSLALNIVDAAPVAAMMMATTGAAFGASLFLTRDGAIPPAEATLFGWGLAFGTYDAILVSLMLSLDGRTTAGTAFAGSALGAAVGLLSARLTGLSQGDASLIASGGLWATAIGLLLLPVLQPTSDFETGGLLFIATNTGLAAGAFAALQVELSQSRVLLMDLGVLLGGLALGGIGVIVFETAALPEAERVIPVLAIAGMLGGGALGLYFGRNVGREGAGGPALLWVEPSGVRLGAPRPGVVFSDGAPAGVVLPVVAGRF